MPLLQKLRRLKINSYDVWRPDEADEADVPDSYPVFIRTRSAHRGVLSGLIFNRADAWRELQNLTCRGFPISDLMFVEYRAEPIANGTFLKHSAYRIGDRMLPAPSVLTNDWVAKAGWAVDSLDDGGAEMLEQERRIILNGVYSEALRSAFEAGKIEYGRADFATVQGRVEVYESIQTRW